MDDSFPKTDQLDQFLYTGTDGYVENLTRYKRNGLHPILLGDILPKPGTCVGNPDGEPRYRVLLKLGFGGFATVWLARDLVDSRYVSVKVCVGSDVPDRSSEATILSEIRNDGQGKPGQERIIQLLDVFTIQGPNGFHECLVTEVVSSLNNLYVVDHCSSDTVYQILEGFAFLHGQGIAHGDPHLANFGIALPQLEQFSEDQITEYFANPEVIPVVPRDASFPLSSVPPYVTPCVSIAEFLKLMKCFPVAPTMSIKILDFGRAHKTSEKLATLPGAVPIMVRPPEVVLYDRFDGRVGSAWSKSADIWALGCTIYQIMSGDELICTRGSLNDYLLRAVRLGGPPPDTWPDISNVENGHENGSQDFNSRDEAWDKCEARGSRRDGKMPLFLDLVKKMVVTNPDERGLATKLLRHNFFRSRTPDVIEPLERVRRARVKIL